MLNRLIFPLLVISLFSCATGAIHKKAIELNTKAIRLIEENNLEMAEKHLELALEYNKNYAEAYNNLGIIYLRQNKIDRAEKYFLTAIEYNSDFAEAHNNLGYVYMIRGDYKKAEHRFKSALNIDPALLNARLNLAKLYMITNEGEKAVSELLKLKIFTKDEEVYALLVSAYLKTGRISNAFDIVDEMLSDNVMAEKGRFLRGYINLALNRCKDAIDDFESVRKKFFDSIEFRINISAAYICAKEYDKAEDILQGVLAIKRDEPAALFNLGRIAYEKKDYALAERYLKKSYELGFYQSCSYLVDTLFSAGKKEESLKVSAECR